MQAQSQLTDNFIIVNSYMEDSESQEFGLRKLDAKTLQVIHSYSPEEFGQISSFCMRGSILVYGTNSGDVCLLDIETFKIPSKLTRRGLGITSLAISDKYVIICNPGENFKIMDTDNKTATIEIPVRDPLSFVAVDKLSSRLASIDEVGNLVVWDISSLKALGLHDNSEKEFKVIHKEKLPYQIGIKVGMAWNPVRDLLCVPTQDEVKIFECKNWGVVHSISTQADDLTCLKWSNDGRHFALSQTNAILVFDEKWNSSEIKHDSKILTFEWSMKDDHFFIANENQTYKWVESGVHTSIVESVNDDDIMKDVKPRKLTIIDDDAKDEDSDLEGLDLADFESDTNENSGLDNDDITGDDDDDESEADDIRLPVREIYSRPTVEIPVHRTREFKVLRSCSTPKSQERQFLNCNNIGYMILRDDNDGPAIIDVEFHDIYRNRANRVVDDKGYTMGAMASAGETSTIYFQRYDSKTSGLWHVELSHGEKVLGVSSGSKYVFAASSRNVVYGFTVSGLQWFPVSFPGEYVSMAASGSNFFVVYAVNGQLKGSLFDYDKFQHLGSVDIYLKESVDLKWMGFMNADQPAIYDSSGSLKVLYPSRGYLWVEMFTVSNSIYERVWPTGFEEGNLLAVELSGSSQYPSTLQRPVMISLELSLSIIPDGYERMNQFLIKKLSENPKDSIDLSEDSKKESDRLLSELILISIKNGQLMKALDYCALLQLENSLEIATKLAIHYNYPQLVSRINLLREKMFPDDEDDNYGVTETRVYERRQDTSRFEEEEGDGDDVMLIQDDDNNDGKENNLKSNSSQKTSFSKFLHRTEEGVNDENTFIDDEGEESGGTISKDISANGNAKKKARVNPFAIKK